VHTFVNDRFLLPEVRKSGEVLDAIVLGESLVVDFDEVHPESVCVVIYLLELGKDFVARQTAPRVWKHTTNISATEQILYKDSNYFSSVEIDSWTCMGIMPIPATE
jgi:hypothetical protein